MKCNYCGTTIPKENKVCNGCGKKVELEENEEIEENEEQEESEELEEVKKTSKNAIDSYMYSLTGIMFPIIGLIFIILAINKAASITDPLEKQKAKNLSKIAIVMNLVTSLMMLLLN